MWISMQTRHHVQASNFSHYAQPMIHYDRVMEVHDLIYMEHGEWEIYEEDTPYLLQTGDVLCLQAGKHHYGLLPCCEGTRTIFIHVFQEKGDGEPCGTSLYVPTLTKAGAHHIGDHFSQLVNNWWTESRDKDLRVSAQLDLLFCDIATVGRLENDPLAWPVNIVHQLFLKNPEHNYSLQALADELQTTPRNLRYMFHRVSGQSIHQYQLTLKLKMAQHLMMIEPWHSLADIATTFGFCDEFHFGHLFHQMYGVSPGTAKKRR